VTAPRPAGPWVGDRVWDATRQAPAVVTDVRRRGLPRPVYVLRHPQALGAHWETDDPDRLCPVEPR
jgi:hypothetical protein